MLYIGSRDGRLYPLDLLHGTPLWEFDTGAEIHSAPLIVGDSVVVGSADGTVHSISAATGDRYWSFETERAVWTVPTLSGDAVYVGDRSGSLYALDKTDGSLLNSLDGDVEESALGEFTAVTTLTVVGDTVFFGNYHGRIYAATVQPGAVGTLWTSEGVLAIQSAPTIAGDRLYVGDLGRVYAIDAPSGDRACTFEPADANHFRASPIVVDGTLYIGNDDGSVYAVETATDRYSTGSRTMFGTCGHHDRHAGFQSSTGLARSRAGDNDHPVADGKRITEGLSSALETGPRQ